MPCAAATALPSSTRPRDERAKVGGRSQTRPCVRPVSAPIGFVEALKITLRHCGPRASLDRVVGMPARVHASASRSTSSNGAGSPRTGRTSCRPSRPIARRPAPMIFPAGNVVPRITRSTWRGERLLVAEPVLHRRDAAAGERVRRRRDRGLGVHRLRRDDPEVARREARPRRTSRAAGRRRRRRRRAAARRVDRVDVRRARGRTPRPRRRRASRDSRRRASRRRRSRRCRFSCQRRLLRLDKPVERRRAAARARRAGAPRGRASR